ncbi:dihydroorotase [Pedobacter sp. ISL-68]|uniref:dihydroorotase n=1 Tax=unclassified Pedobacter TaxID=2628915 RepID=UPI001BEC0F36|nr:MULTISPECIES: dihydroorotase [unclassified Pedobacter]MBT2564067.1 dihydroorotase [Pedobacter sp. ISL-64]MBT2589799.1 dihydroorotase [Pedobacter sp. ISL-68]
MNLLVKNVAIADPQSKFNNQQCDVRVENGKIKNIGKLTADKNETVFDAQGAFLTPGFFDLNCVAGDPGFETKEDIQTLTATAKAGGFTGLALLPQTSPVVQSKSQVEYIINRAKNNLVDVLPVGAISQNREAKELAELFDMQQAGAVAFSDGDKALQDDGFMSRALQYAKGFDALLMVYPENKSIAGKSQINESKNSVLLGMKGLPALAEEMHIARDIFLAAYNETKIHISNISTAGSVALIRKAKKDGVQVSCDVTAHHLVFTEELLSDFDSNYKVKPPLRGKADVKALIAGLKDGTIDAITSQHRPEEIEFKNVEFEIAHYGIIALQTVLPLLLKAGLDIALIVEKLVINPRKLLNLAIPVIEEGAEANFTVLNTAEKWLYNAASNYSKSANSPLLGTELTGKVKLVYNNNQYWES